MNHEIPERENAPMEIDELLRRSARRIRSEFRRPPDEDVLAFLEGRATELQRDAVLDGVARSPEFREELEQQIDQRAFPHSQEKREAFARAAASPEADTFVASVLASLKPREGESGRPT
jgi:hypothetical protein